MLDLIVIYHKHTFKAFHLQTRQPKHTEVLRTTHESQNITEAASFAHCQPWWEQTTIYNEHTS